MGSNQSPERQDVFVSGLTHLYVRNQANNFVEMSGVHRSETRLYPSRSIPPTRPRPHLWPIVYPSLASASSLERTLPSPRTTPPLARGGVGPVPGYATRGTWLHGYATRGTREPGEGYPKR